VSIEISQPLLVNILRSFPEILRLKDEKAVRKTDKGGTCKGLCNPVDFKAELKDMNFAISSTKGVVADIPGETTPLPEQPRPEALESKVTLCP
jgi:hypothetical protein